MGRISFLRKTLKEFRVSDYLASSGKLLFRCRVDGKKEYLYWFVLADTVFKSCVHLANCIEKQN